jgi:hypothetical protein
MPVSTEKVTLHAKGVVMPHTWLGLDLGDGLPLALALALWLVAIALYGLTVVVFAAQSRLPR